MSRGKGRKERSTESKRETKETQTDEGKGRVEKEAKAMKDERRGGMAVQPRGRAEAKKMGKTNEQRKERKSEHD